MTTTWGSAEFDLDAYLARIDHHGERAPTAAVLHALQRGHVGRIPFENLEIQLGRPILLDLPSLQDKLVRRRRGGYCFEHAMLFAAALTALGYGVEGLTARVRFGQQGQLPETHALLRVTVPGDGSQWFCDVGFGQNSPVPVEFREGAETEADGRRYRLVREGRLWVWQFVRVGADGTEEVVDAHATEPVERLPIDYEVGSFYVSRHPRSPFVTRPIAAHTVAGVRHALNGRTLRTTRPGGAEEEVRELDPEEVPKVLEGIFDIALDEADGQALVARLRALAEEEAARDDAAPAERDVV